MSITNPYSAPAVPGSKGTKVAGSGGAIEPLNRTRPWVIFLGILGMVATASILVSALLILILGMSAEAPVDSEASPLAGVIIISVTMILSALLYFIPSLLLLRYGIAIGRFVAQPTGIHLEQALNQQRLFWFFAGLMTLIMILLNILGAVVAMVLGVSLVAAG